MDGNKNTHASVRMTQVRKKGLSEFEITLRSEGGVLSGGRVTCVWDGATREFCDVNELMRFVEGRCDAVWYPQSQRKLRGWG